MIYPIRRIVAGVGELEGPDPALAAAVALAERTGATLHLVHAFELPDPMWDAYARMGYADAEMLHLYTLRVRDRLEARARAFTARPDVHCHAVPGPPAASIRAVAAEEGADLVVVGATRRGVLSRALLGTTAQRVLRSAGVPVLVARGELPAPVRRVLLTTDLSPFSAGIHEAGLDVLETLFAGDAPELRSLLVTWYGEDLPAPLTEALVERTARQGVRDFLRERRPRTRPVAGSVRFGEPAREIAAEAAEWGADLVVVGTHSRTGAQRWLLGSVAESAVRGAEVSVLVIPARVEEQRTLPVVRATAAAAS